MVKQEVDVCSLGTTKAHAIEVKYWQQCMDPATKSYKEITMETGRIGKTSKRSRYAAWRQSKRMQQKGN